MSIKYDESCARGLRERCLASFGGGELNRGSSEHLAVLETDTTGWKQPK